VPRGCRASHDLGEIDEWAPPIQYKWQNNRERGDGSSRLDLELTNMARICVVNNLLARRLQTRLEVLLAIVRRKICPAEPGSRIQGAIASARQMAGGMCPERRLDSGEAVQKQASYRRDGVPSSDQKHKRISPAFDFHSLLGTERAGMNSRETPRRVRKPILFADTPARQRVIFDR